MPKRDPKPCSLCGYFRYWSIQKLYIVASLTVFFHRIYDISIYMVLGRASRIIGTYLFSVDCAPGKESSFFRHNLSPLSGLIENRISVFEELPGDLRHRIYEKRKNIYFGIPEIMTFIAFSRQAFCGKTGLAFSASRLKHMKKIESERLLNLTISLYNHISAFPKFRKKAPLLVEKHLEAILRRSNKLLVSLCPA